MRITLTGATGFLGARTAVALAKLGHEVTGIGRNVAVGRRLEEEDVYFVRAELSNLPRLKEAFRGRDCVIHLAALTRAGALPEDYRKTNVVGTRNVMQAMAGSSVRRWIHMSTSRLYSGGEERFGIRETQSIASRNVDPYLESKRLNEVDIETSVTIPCMILRPQLIFGPGDRRLYPFLARFATWGRVPQFDDGNTFIDPIYVDNVVDAIAAAVEADDQAYDSAYNLSNGIPVENFAFLTMLAETMGRNVRGLHLTRERGLKIASILEPIYRTLFPNSETPLPAGYVRLFSESQTLNCDLAKSAFGFRPKIDTKEGLHTLGRLPRHLR